MAVSAQRFARPADEFVGLEESMRRRAIALVVRGVQYRALGAPPAYAAGCLRKARRKLELAARLSRWSEETTIVESVISREVAQVAAQ